MGSFSIFHVEYPCLCVCVYQYRTPCADLVSALCFATSTHKIKHTDNILKMMIFEIHLQNSNHSTHLHTLYQHTSVLSRGTCTQSLFNKLRHILDLPSVMPVIYLTRHTFIIHQDLMAAFKIRTIRISYVSLHTYLFLLPHSFIHFYV